MSIEELSKEKGASEQEFSFRNVKLFKNETLGTGSYGAVCKAKCDQLICAAKLLYPVLFQMQAPDQGSEHKQPFKRFEQECQFLSRINHPNIVQYLGTYRDPETNAPVLLMELMDESLTHFLGSSHGDIPYHIQVNLSQDIAQALAFLHANGIIHRDLSSNNVLLVAGSRAKVSDLGMSKFADINKTRLASMTTCPGTVAFMSPEALNEPPLYTEKLDTFSLGVLLVQIITQIFPDPANRFQTMEFPNPQKPSYMIQALVPISEVERRRNHISLIEPTHPLLPIALECLKDIEVERPSSKQVCQSMDSLKKTDKYEESVKNKTQEAFAHQQLQEEARAKEKKTQNRLTEFEKEIEELRDQLEQTQMVNKQEISARDEEILRLNQQLQIHLDITANLQQTISQQESEIIELKKIDKKPNLLRKRSSLSIITQVPQAEAKSHSKQAGSMKWSPQPNSPIGISAGSAAENKGRAYYKTSSGAIVYELNPAKGLWFELPPHQHPLKDYTIVNVDNTLTTVGGMFESRPASDKYSSQLYCYEGGKWEKRFRSMSTRRASPGAVSTHTTLIVAGGLNESGLLNTVEIMDIRSKEWSTVSSLPFPTTQPSVAIWGRYLYLHPRNISLGQDTYKQTVLKCSIGDLKFSSPKSMKWKNISSLPVSSSTLVAVNGNLLAVGGQTKASTLKEVIRTKEIYEYDQTKDSWQVVSEMLEARCACLTAVLPDNKLIVAGGASSGDYTMETATLH